MNFTFFQVMSSIYLTSIFYDIICASETHQNSMVRTKELYVKINDRGSIRGAGGGGSMDLPEYGTFRDSIS